VKECDHKKTVINPEESFIVCENCGQCIKKVLIPSMKEKVRALKGSEYIRHTISPNKIDFFIQSDYPIRLERDFVDILKGLFNLFEINNPNGQRAYLEHMVLYKRIKKQLNQETGKRLSSKRSLICALFFFYLKKKRNITIDEYYDFLVKSSFLFSRKQTKPFRSLAIKVGSFLRFSVNNGNNGNNGNCWEDVNIYLRGFLEETTYLFSPKELSEIKSKYIQFYHRLNGFRSYTLLYTLIYALIERKPGSKYRKFVRNGIDPSNYTKIRYAYNELRSKQPSLFREVVK